jgi:hypothetical protein
MLKKYKTKFLRNILIIHLNFKKLIKGKRRG